MGFGGVMMDVVWRRMVVWEEEEERIQRRELRDVVVC